MSEQDYPDFDADWALPAREEANGGPLPSGQLVDIKGESGPELLWPGPTGGTNVGQPPSGYTALQGFNQTAALSWVPPFGGYAAGNLGNGVPGYGLQSHQPPSVASTPPMTEQQIRKLVHEMVEQELYPGVIDASRYRHIQITDDDGTRWRGMVYCVEKPERA
jgi:hypothetical protein